MNMDALSAVKFGDIDSLQNMLFENAIQHRLFSEVIMDAGYTVPRYPLFEADPKNLDDWLQMHQVEHQAFAGLLNLENPFNLLDVDLNVEEQFQDFLSTHLYLHEQIASVLGLS